MVSSSIGSVFINIIVAPAQALNSLREQPRAWFPLLLLAGVWIALWFWYYQAVDYAWLIDHMIAVETRTAPADQQEAITRSISKLKPGALIILSSLLVIAVLLLVSVLTSGYLVIVSAILDHDYRFRHWFSLTLWTSIPSLFSIMVMALNFMLTQGGRVAPENLNPLTFGNLLGLKDGHRYGTLLDSIDLSTLWTYGLLALGFRLWTQRSWAQSLLIVLIPFLAIYGIWALLA